LKPSKCKFVQQEVMYLGHVITPAGLKPNKDRVAAVKDYLVPQNIKELRQFLGAQPLHVLTRKNVNFLWTTECQIAFDELKEKLVSAPVLVYPNFERSFVLETDASIRGLGAVPSQYQENGQIHPVAFASRALSAAGKNYFITDLETLAVIWAVSHFHVYLYGHDVEVRTDYSAVKAVLGTPSPSGKHACWWTKGLQ